MLNLENNAILNNRYEILRPVGSGGMAEVYLAKDMLLDREVAIKMLRAQFKGDKELLEQFRREAKSAARLNHPYIISIYDVVTDEDAQYIVMEYVDGITLKSFMEEQRLSLGNVLDIGARMAEGLQYAHNRGVVHCDIKPLNILIDKSFNPKIADFGIAKVVSSQTMVYTNAIMGSVHYISPEQAGGGAVTSLSDVYSLGVVLFEMLTGQVPFNGGTAVAVAMMHAEKPVPLLGDYMETVPEGMQEIINRAMAKRPEDRYSCAVELRDDLLALRMQLDPGGFELTGGLEQERIGSAIDSEAASTVVMQPVRSSNAEEELAKTLVIPRSRALGAVDMDEQERESLSELAAGAKKEEEQRGMAVRKKINYTRLLLLVTGVVVLISLIAHFVFSAPKAIVVIPNVVNMEVETAQKQLGALNLKVELDEKYADQTKYKPGTVIEQSVKEGEKRKEGSLIILYVSKGAEIKGIPDLKGMSTNKATSILEGLGFKLGKVDKKYVKGEKIGAILEQNPKAADKAPKGSTVDVVVCEGDRPIPALRGKTRTEAARLLQSVGLALGNVRVIEDSNVGKDVVVSSNPDAGVRLAEGDKVDITVSNGGSVSSSYVDFAIPGNKTVNVSIIVEDNSGKRTVYSGTKKGGIRIRQKVETKGKARATLIVDGKTVEEKAL